jgi:phage-related protein
MSTVDDDSSEVIFLADRPTTPPLSAVARGRVGRLLRLLQDGEMIGLPISRPMPSIGARVHELRVQDDGVAWRVIYRIDPGSIVVAHVFAKTTRATPKEVIKRCRKRFRDHDAL